MSKNMDMPQSMNLPEDEEIDDPETVPLLLRQLFEQPVQTAETQRVLIQGVEKRRIHQEAEDLGRRRVFGTQRCRLRRRWPVLCRDGEDTGRAEVDGRGQRRREPDAPIAIPGVFDADRREEER